MNEEQARCAKINFENLEKAMPFIKQHPYYVIAKGQLDEALGDKPELMNAELERLAKKVG